MSHHSEIEELIPKLNSCGAEFCEYAAMVNQEVECPEGLSDDDAWDKYESTLAQHQSITEQFYEIYQKQKECQAVAKRYHFNPFVNLCDLLETFQEIVEKYLPTKMKTVMPIVTPTVPSAGYFDMGLVSAIHKLCNGEQFEAISELDLYVTLNNQAASAEKTRMCYLIYSLSKLREQTKLCGVAKCFSNWKFPKATTVLNIVSLYLKFRASNQNSSLKVLRRFYIKWVPDANFIKLQTI